MLCPEEASNFREAEDLADAEQKLAASPEAFGQTNRQVQTVDEADRIKNDGRYLYQIARKAIKKENESESIQTGIQILDTKDGLKETAFLTGLEGLEEFCPAPSRPQKRALMWKTWLFWSRAIMRSASIR